MSKYHSDWKQKAMTGSNDVMKAKESDKKDKDLIRFAQLNFPSCFRKIERLCVETNEEIDALGLNVRKFPRRKY